MKTEIIQAMTETFEGHAQQTDGGVEYWLARDVQYLFGYAEWRNFEGVIERARNLIKHKHLYGSIEQTTKTVRIGSGATRFIVDYRVDRPALLVIHELASSHKLTNVYSIRCETVVLQLVEKYCRLNGLHFEYQFRLEDYVFDCAIGGYVLIEFDEPHHEHSPRQRLVDKRKNEMALKLGWVLFRVTLEMDIVDIIVKLQEWRYRMTIEDRYRPKTAGDIDLRDHNS
jgi:very-short-patch-repair endonuclease